MAAGMTATIVPLPDLTGKGADISDYLETHNRDKLLELVAAAAPKSNYAIGYTYRQLIVQKFPDRKGLIYRGDMPIFSAGNLAETFAIRGVGKTWLMMSLALIAACGGEVLGFRCPLPCRALYIDGEMSRDVVVQRFIYLGDLLKIPRDMDNLVIVAADWQEDPLPLLDTEAGQEFIRPFIEKANFIIPDNRSCLFDSEGEKDPTAWQPAQEYLLSLRRRGKSTWLAHHANRKGDARGISKAEDPMDVLLKLVWPEDYSADQGARFTATFENNRNFCGDSAAPFTARLTTAGWVLEVPEAEHGQQKEPIDEVKLKILDYLRLAADVGERPTSFNEVLKGMKHHGIGINRNDASEVFRQMYNNHEIARDVNNPDTKRRKDIGVVKKLV